jgi:hypothetical protein
MNERIHKVLDGELSRGELTPAEVALLAEYEGTLAAAERTIPRFEAPDLSTSVMARIAALETPAAAPVHPTLARNPLARAFDWLWTPRPMVFRPAWGLAAATVAALAFFVTMPGAEQVEAPIAVAAPNGGGATQPEIYVAFRLDAPDASSVHLAGDFTGWEPEYELHQSQPGVWTVVVPLVAGVHDYAFVIDGEQWTPDPLATAVDDGFGGQNSRLSLLPPERIRA